MSTKQLPDLERDLMEAWPSEKTALEVLHVVAEIEDELANYITIPLVVQLLSLREGKSAASAAGDRSRIERVYRFVEYLASEAIGLLDLHFELQRADASRETLDTRAVLNAFKGGQLYDPATGYAIPNWEKHVVPYYSATDLLREIRRERH